MSYVTIYKVEQNGDVVDFAEGTNNHVFAPLVWDIFLAKYGYDGGKGRYADDRYDAMWKAWPDPKMPRIEQVLLGATFDRVWIKRETIPALIEACEWFLKEHIKKPHKRLDYKTNTMVDSFYDDRALAGDPEEMMGFDGKMMKLTRRNPGIIAALKQIYEDPTARGAAFNCCSAVSSFWSVCDVPHVGENEDGSIKHTKDEDCAPHVKDDECEICGVWRQAEACEDCGKHSFHSTECSQYEWETRPWNVDKDTTQPRGEYKGKSAWELTEGMEKPEVSLP